MCMAMVPCMPAWLQSRRISCSLDEERMMVLLQLFSMVSLKVSGLFSSSFVTQDLLVVALGPWPARCLRTASIWARCSGVSRARASGGMGGIPVIWVLTVVSHSPGFTSIGLNSSAARDANGYRQSASVKKDTFFTEKPPVENRASHTADAKAIPLLGHPAVTLGDGRFGQFEAPRGLFGLRLPGFPACAVF